MAARGGDRFSKSDLHRTSQRGAQDEARTPRWRRGLFGGGSTVTSRHASGWHERHWTSRVLHRVGEVVAHSGAGIVAASVVLAWTVVGISTSFPHWWETVLYSATAAVTFVMVFVIQHTQARQVSATQRKLDELLRSTTDADELLIAVEEAPDEDLQALTERNVTQREQAFEQVAQQCSDRPSLSGD
jgi:low affinity Fe/Cu permease